jgi:signal recognition particle GTPase
MNSPHNISVGVSDCIVVAAIVSLTVTYVTGFRDQITSDTQHSTHSDQMVPDNQFNSSSSASASDQKVSSSANPPLILNITNSIPSSATLPESPNAPSPGDRIPSLERRNSIQRRASLRAQGSFRPIDEMEDEEDRSNRATKELVERIQKQNEEYKKTNQSLKAQLDSLTDQLIEVNLQRAELLTNIDYEVLEKRKLRERLQWYEWIDVWGYLWSQNPENGQIARASLPEPGTEELIDTE